MLFHACIRLSALACGGEIIQDLYVQVAVSPLHALQRHMLVYREDFNIWFGWPGPNTKKAYFKSYGPCPTHILFSTYIKIIGPNVEGGEARRGPDA